MGKEKGQNDNQRSAKLKIKQCKPHDKSRVNSSDICSCST